MTDLSGSFAKVTLAPLQPEPSSLVQDEDPDPSIQEREDDSSSASSMSSVGTVRPSSSHKAAIPIPWTHFFSQELYLEKKTGTQHAKYHVYAIPPKNLENPLLVLHHGAGSSGMSFALFVREIRRLEPDVGVLCLEAREHGSAVWDTETGNVNADMSIDVLSQDMADMVYLSQEKLGWEKLPMMMLVGHSLGGAVVTNTAKNRLLGDQVLGYAVLDVVEGSALDTLKSMQSYLATRPSVFPNIDAAIDWHVRSKTIRNAESATASVPPLFLQTHTGKYIWRTNLTKTEAYWEDWFGGMSGKFLNAMGAKLLILAGKDRLDKELMIGQMQGKFQLQVLPAAGHFVQEDLPVETARIIAEFVKRNDNSKLVLPPKVADLIAQGKKV